MTTTEPKFHKLNTFGIGIPAAFVGAWGLADYGVAVVMLTIPIAFAGAYLWSFLMWRLMFRDRFARIKPIRDSHETPASSSRPRATAIGQEGGVTLESFEVTYDATSAARAERAFYVRSIRELRAFVTFAPPIALAAFVAAGFFLGAPTYFVAFFAFFLCCSVLFPIFMYFARPLAVKRDVIRHPVRKFTLTPESIQIEMGGRSTSIAWGRIEYVWEAGDHILLVLGVYTALSIPSRSLPTGARDFIQASATNGG